MFKHNLWATCVAVLLILFSNSCSTELEINAPYKKTAVVYGLLDFNQPRQYIKIMKTYQNGNGNAYDFAKVTDSLYFKNITVKLINLNNGSEIMLQKDNSIPMLPGTFASDSNFLYYTDVPLSKHTAYSLDITDNDTKEKFTAVTNMVDSASWRNPSRTVVIPFEVKDNQYYTVSWYTASYAYLYDLVVRLHYTDYILNSQGQVIDSVNQVLDWPASKNFRTPNQVGGDQMVFSISQLNLFSFMAANIPVKNNVKRKAYWVDFRLFGASEELATYVLLNSPSFGVVQKSSSYTNVKNGLGIFSSRNLNEIKGVPVSSVMQGIMASHQTIKSLKFF